MIFLPDHPKKYFKIIRQLGLFVWDLEVSPTQSSIFYTIRKNMKERRAKKSMSRVRDQITYKTIPIALPIEGQNWKNQAKSGQPSLSFIPWY